MVLVEEPSGWVAFFCTDVSATVAEILSTVADRFSLEIAFRDCKEIVGAGQQQVRFVWANIGAFHICLWTFTMTEAWAWGREEDQGQRTLNCSSSNDLQQVVVIPAATATFHGQARAVGMLFQE